MLNNKDILTTKDVAAYLHLHPLTVHRYARQGLIPAFKIGTDWRYHKKYIESWIKQKVMSSSKGKKGSSDLFEKKETSRKAKARDL